MDLRRHSPRVPQLRRPRRSSVREQVIRKHLDAVARRARESGVRTTQVAFHSPRPVKVALEVAQEEQIGLIVFGANRKELGKRYFRKAVKRIRADAPCLVWIDD